MERLKSRKRSASPGGRGRPQSPPVPSPSWAIDSSLGGLSESKSVLIRIGPDKTGPLGLLLGVESPLEVIEKGPRVGIAGEGRAGVNGLRGVISNLGVTLSESKKSVFRIWSCVVPCFFSGLGDLKLPKFGSRVSKSSSSSSSIPPSSISLSEEGPADHSPNAGTLVPGELLLDPDPPVANIGAREGARWDPALRCIEEPNAALAELLRLP